MAPLCKGCLNRSISPHWQRAATLFLYFPANSEQQATMTVIGVGGGKKKTRDAARARAARPMHARRVSSHSVEL